MEHGYTKLLKGPQAFASILHALGVPASHLMAYLIIFDRITGGLRRPARRICPAGQRSDGECPASCYVQCALAVRF
jgi:hypothetical protein